MVGVLEAARGALRAAMSSRALAQTALRSLVR